MEGLRCLRTKLKLFNPRLLERDIQNVVFFTLHPQSFNHLIFSKDQFCEVTFSNICYCFSYEPGNPIFGTVHNPHNLKHGPGGSSSGEAALIASGASILGIGSDIGGSARVPAHFTGICTLKPTVQRMR